jgi:ribonuclease Z
MRIKQIHTYLLMLCLALNLSYANADGPEKPSSHNRFNTEEITINPGDPRWFASPETNTYVVSMGTSTPSPNPYRFGASGAIIANGTPYLIDAGDGILRAIAKSATAHDMKLVDAYAPAKLTTLFITHLHSDHTVGLPSLMLNTWIFGRATPMEIYGPVGTKNLVDNIIKAYDGDIHERIYGAEGANNTGWKVNVHEITQDGVILENDKIKVEAFSHRHGTLNNYGYKFTTADRSIIWAGDGQQGEAFEKAAKDIDILVTELASEDNVHNSPWGGLSDQEKERVIWSYHMKPRDLAKLASEAEVKQLVLIHESNYSKPYDPLALVNEMKKEYSGKVSSSRDADVF